MRQLSAAFALATLTACGRDPEPPEGSGVNSKVASTPTNASAPSSVSKAPKASPLILPPGKLKSTEVQSWRLGGEWKPVDLKTASELVSALSENHRHFRPENVICELFAAPKWSFRFNWDDGTSMLVSLSAEGGMIQGIEVEHGGVKDDENYGTYIVESKRTKEILEHCPFVEEFTKETCAVCGISVLSNTPFSKGRGSKLFYFCSEEHFDRFEQDPESFENGPKSSPGEEHR